MKMKTGKDWRVVALTFGFWICGTVVGLYTADGFPWEYEATISVGLAIFGYLLMLSNQVDRHEGMIQMIHEDVQTVITRLDSLMVRKR